MLHTRMTTLVGALAVGAAFLAVAPASAAAHPPSGAQIDSVTGCLQKGDKPNTFTLTSKDGKAVTVASQTVSLAGHVGHTVTLTGSSTPSDSSSMGAMKDSMKDTAMGKMGDSMKHGGAGMHGGVMQVTKLTMVSASCP
jgi:hypothetical protein